MRLDRYAAPAAALSLAFAVAAQTVEGVPVEHVVRIPPGGLVDLDTGAVLSQAELRPLQADLRFDRDGRGFFVLPLHGGMVAGEQDTSPGADWTADRLRLGGRQTEPHTWFLRTDRGAVARVTLAVVDPYSTASAVLQWALAPPALPVFRPGPTDLRARWGEQALEVTWTGDAPRWLVEVETGGAPRKVTTTEARVALADLDRQGVHRIRVRGLHEGGVVSLPAEIVRHGPDRPPVRGEVHLADRWYDATGGLSLARGETADEDADVVFYLYGVYVPGGGVQKVGKGAAAWRALAELPERGYLPSYGRLDEGDVLAVRIADGRQAKLWLVPDDGSDLRSGMKVRYAFLADGRRHLLPAPSGLRSETVAGGLQVRWNAVDGAKAYRVLEPGKAAPTRVESPGILLAALAPNRYHALEISAVGADGEESDALADAVHTFGPDFRIGRFTLRAQEAGWRFADGSTVADGFDLRIESSAGGASYLRLAAPHGATRLPDAPFGELAGAAGARHEPTIECDDRHPGSDVFLVKTGDGRHASVRIRQRDYPRIEFDYVLEPVTR